VPRLLHIAFDDEFVYVLHNFSLRVLLHLVHPFKTNWSLSRRQHDQTSGLVLDQHDLLSHGISPRLLSFRLLEHVWLLTNLQQLLPLD
jgi:hypothetical protein